MIDFFEELLKELSTHFGFALHPDSNGICLLDFEDQVKLYIEYVSDRKRLLLASHLAEVPPGKLREKILGDALKANNAFPPSYYFGYSPKNNQLSLFYYLKEEELQPEAVFAYIQAFHQVAVSWQKGMETGTTNQLILKPYS